jgi:hypothetical protein
MRLDLLAPVKWQDGEFHNCIIESGQRRRLSPSFSAELLAFRAG